MKVIFLGTPYFGKVVLENIYNSKHEVCAVVCQEDKPNGRGNKIEICETKKFALQHNIPVYQFHKIRLEGVEPLKKLNADIMVTAAYGQILSQEVLDICPKGVINAHGSILPKYRGASPVQSALLNGEKETGITVLQTQIGMDDGDIILTKKIAIDDNDNSETLMNKLAPIGGELIVEVLDLIQDNKATFTPQNHNEATFTKMLKKENAVLNFDDTATNLVNKIRAYNPNPVVKICIDKTIFKVFSAKVIEGIFEGQNGVVLEASGKKGLLIKCNENALEILEIQPENGKRMLAKNYLNGKKIEKGTLCN